MKKLLLISTILLTEAFIANAQNRQIKHELPSDDNSNPKNNFCLVFGLAIQKTNVTCYGGNNGNVIVYAFGGKQPYSYSWSPSGVISLPLDTIDVAALMSAGTYTCTITDSVGCTFKLIVTITQPPKLTVTTSSSVNDICHGGNSGSAIVSAGGGTLAYTYGWAPSVSTTNSASNLSAGNYIVTVTDSNRCTAKDTITITQPLAIAISTATVPSSCKISNGAVSVTASNGVVPYSYIWAPGGNTTNSVTGLAGGNYTCTVADANGCKSSAAAVVGDSTTLSISLLNSANIKCYGGNNGLAAFSVIGGMGTDTYNWLPTGGTSTFASGLSAGTYTFTAIDSVGCKAFTIISITQPKQLRDSMTRITNIACYGGTTGRVTAGVSGGTSPYTYLWSTGATTAGISGLAPGTFTVKVTDNNGCLDSANITLTQPATAVADSNKVGSISCHGGTANATVYAYGGVHPYNYTWAPGGNTTNSATGLAAGSYVVSIRDSNQCRVRDTIIITQPPSFILANDTLLSFPCNSKAWVKVIGTLSKYTFSWSPSGGTRDTAASLCAGVYAVTITDSTGCVENDTIKIINNTGIQQYINDENIKIFPVPARNQINVVLIGNNFLPQTITVFDAAGRELLTEKLSANTSLFTIDVSKFAEGTYFLKLTGNSIKVVKFLVAGK